MKTNTLTLLFIIIALHTHAQKVGINTPTPSTTLDVNGALATRATTVNPSSNNVNIPDHISFFVIGNGAPCTDTIICTFAGTWIDGQHLTIFNNNACTKPAKFAGTTIPYLSAMNFICKTPGGWYPMVASESPLSNNWKLNGNSVDTSNFIGTTNDAAIKFKSNNTAIGYLNQNTSNIHFGEAYPNGTNYIGINNNSIGYKAMEKQNNGSGNTAIGGYALNSDTSGNENVAIGGNALRFSKSKNGLVAIGNNALMNNANRLGLVSFQGVNNTAVGYNAMQSNISGGLNTALGSNALATDSAGVSNVAIGSMALQLANNSIGNIGIGVNALKVIKNGSGNVAIGTEAMGNAFTNNPVSVRSNIAIGQYALQNTKGLGSVAIGTGALQGDTSDVATYNVAIGAYAMANNINSGNSNVAIGNASLIQNSGEGNVVIGSAAANGSLKGDGKVAIGFEAMLADTASDGNIAIGRRALYISNARENIAIGDSAMANATGTAIDNGNSNIALGKNALLNDGNGNNNIALGHRALMSNTYGSKNIALGYGALLSNQVGNRNIAIGDSVLSTSISAIDNIAIGNNSMKSSNNIDANSNIGIGLNTLKNNQGSSNVAVGGLALEANNNGIGNVAVGNYAAMNNTNGSYNVSIGWGTFVGLSTTGTDRSYNVLIGRGAGRGSNSSNKLYIESDETLNLFTHHDSTNSLIYGDFLNDSLLFNAKTIVRDALKVKNIGDNTGIELGYLNSTKQADNGKIQYGGFGGGNHVLNIVGGGTNAAGNDRAIKLWAYGGLEVMGTPYPTTDNFYTLGTSAKRWFSVWAANGTIQTSDANLKTNIAPLNYGLNTVLKLKPVSYNWKATPTADRNIGFLAQEVQQVIPEAVVDMKDGSPLGMKYSEIIPVLVNAIQELQKSNVELLERIKVLEKK